MCIRDRDNIYKERRYEFAMEGIRYWDLVRTNQAKDFIKGWDDTKKYLPIPQSEIDKSDGCLLYTSCRLYDI